MCRCWSESWWVSAHLWHHHFTRAKVSSSCAEPAWGTTRVHNSLLANFLISVIKYPHNSAFRTEYPQFFPQYRQPMKSPTVLQYTLFSHSEDPLGLWIFPHTANQVILLGFPIGQAEFVRNAIESQINKVDEIINKYNLLDDAQSEFCILRSCLSLSKVMYLLQTTDRSLFKSSWSHFNGLIHNALGNLLSLPLSELCCRPSYWQI